MLKNKSKSKFTYVPRTIDEVRKRSELASRFDNPFNPKFRKFKARQGDNTVRFLPATFQPGKHFGIDVWIHPRVGSTNSDYLCLQKMKSKRCPICDAEADARRSGETEDAKKYAPVHKVLCWILDRNAGKDDEFDPLLYPMTEYNDKDIADVSENKKTGAVIPIDNPTEGFDVTFRRTGEGLRTRYSAWQVDRDPTPIADDSRTYEEIIDFLNDNPLPSVLKYYDEKYLEGILNGTREEKDEDLDNEEDDEEEEETPRTRRTRQVEEEIAPDDDDEEEEDEDDDDDSEEESDEDDEESDSDDDEEEDSDDEEDEESDEPAEEETRPARRRVTSPPPKRKVGGTSGRARPRR